MANLQQFIETYTQLETRSYSGRGMYGASCLAVAADDVGDVIKQLACPASEDPTMFRQVEQDLDGIRTDSMGRGIVIYFPSAKFETVTDNDCNEEHECEENCQVLGCTNK
jgi:hypothetical protein